MNNKSKIKIGFLSTYTPRQCGIATYTKSLVEIISQLYLKDPVSVLAVSNEKGIYKYQKEVVFEIDQFNPVSYIKAAEYVNESPIEVVNIQHEYGIFGGEDGNYIIKFLQCVNKPVITTLHSVLKIHSPHRQELTQKILDLSDKVVVMTESAKKVLIDTFKIVPNKIVVIRHGVPNVRYDDKEKAKKKLKLIGKKVFCTFGLINRGKGIEHAIEAMREITKKHPDSIYLVIGATHPNVKRREGENYRRMLENLVRKYGLDKNVYFINKFLDYNQLVDYLVATDIYLSPQKDLNQSFSGAISYAMGCGCAIISSPTAYALEVLANNRGIIIKPEPKTISREVDKILVNGTLRKIQLRCYNYARAMIWPEVGLKKLGLMEKQIYLQNEKWRQRLPRFAKAPENNHLISMTTKIGIVQHAIKSKPDFRFGYSLDDQARALIACIKQIKLFGKNTRIEELVNHYLDYLEIAIDETGIIHNFINSKGKIIDQYASADSVSRAFWSLAYLVNSKSVSKANRDKAKKLIMVYEARIFNTYLRPIAFNLIGYSFLGDKNSAKRLADSLVERFLDNTENNWRWFEEEMTWGNGIIPYALVRAYRLTKEKRYLDIAIEAANFLEKVTRKKNIPAPVGQEEWYRKNHTKALYDQQPIEAADMVLLFNELYYATDDEKYRQKALEWMGWFFGNNISETIMYDNITHGILDGLGRTGPNLNQGAESIAIYLLAYLSFSGDDQML